MRNRAGSEASVSGPARRRLGFSRRYDADGRAVDLFCTNYLEVVHNGAETVTYPYTWSGPVNTGVASGHKAGRSDKGRVHSTLDIPPTGYSPPLWRTAGFLDVPVEVLVPAEAIGVTGH